MNRFRRRPSPALVIACIALAISLGGTGYAAVVLPANSVGTKQLRTGAVVASKVKPYSLLASNFKNGQIPAGPQGPQGVAGLQGAAGQQGAQGAKGDAATKLFAAVLGNPTNQDIKYGATSGVVGSPVRQQQQNVFQLTFNQDVSKCAVLAVSALGTMPVAATVLQDKPAVVAVETVTSSDDTFTVGVFC